MLKKPYSKPSNGHSPEGCGSSRLELGDPEELVLERNHYFPGKLLTADDEIAEQTYLLNRLAVHHRLFHGWGVLRGMEVVEHPTPECRKYFVIVKPGFGLDEYGRLVVSPCEHRVRWPEGEKSPKVLGLRLKLVGLDEVPVILDESGIKESEPNRVLEEGCLGWYDPAHFPLTGHEPDSVGLKLEGQESSVLLKGASQSEGVIPLALVCPEYDSLKIGLCVRRELPSLADPLTRIQKTSWEHRGKIHLADLQHGLVVYFNQDLGVDNGLDASTFLVTFRDTLGGLCSLQPQADQPLWNREEPRNACFQPDYEGSKRLRDLCHCKEVPLRITILGDLIRDHRGRAIDANHIRGTLPSGDGVEGGTFESIVTVSLKVQPQPTKPPPVC